MRDVSAAREAAFRILLEVERGQAHSDDLLRARFVHRLAPVDRNLTTALVLGTLRWQIALDGAIRQFLAKPNAKLDAEVRIALRMGALQLTRMERIPAHAALAESVELVKQAGHSFAARMVNAVLRKLAQSASAAPRSAAEDDRPLTSASEMALRYGHPAWLVERWRMQYGAEQAQQLCAHGQQQPALHLRLADQAAEAELAQEGLELAPAPLLTAARTLVAGDIVRSRALREGRARIQDEGSQLVAELAVASAPQEKIKICDACAAPGGKTLLLAERLRQAQIVACERSAPRAEALATRLAPLRPRVSIRTLDAATLAAEEAFDLILVDAPCSGTGTLGRNPEIRHRLKPEEFARQSERQIAILTAALRAVRMGGRVLYSTCSLEHEENDAVVARALEENSSVRQIPLSFALDALAAQGVLAAGAAEPLQRALTPEGALRLLPGALPTDGFFVALFERVS